MTIINPRIQSLLAFMVRDQQPSGKRRAIEEALKLLLICTPTLLFFCALFGLGAKFWGTDYLCVHSGAHACLHTHKCLDVEGENRVSCQNSSAGKAHSETKGKGYLITRSIYFYSSPEFLLITLIQHALIILFCWFYLVLFYTILE